MTALLGYIDHCIVLKNIMLVTFYYAVIMINVLQITLKISMQSYKLCILLLNIYMLATLVKQNSAY